MCLYTMFTEVVKVVQETTVEEVAMEEVVEEVQEELPVELEPATVAPQFIQVFDDVVCSTFMFN